MFLKLFCVQQFIIVQIISAQLSNRELPSQNAVNNLVNIPFPEFSGPRRQVNNPSINLPGNGNLPGIGLANGLPFRNGMSFGNLPRGNGLPNALTFNNGLPNNFALNNGMALPNNSPQNLPFTRTNNVPQNMLPNVNGINNNGILFNTMPNGLANFNNLPARNGLQNLINVPAGNNILNFNNLPAANTLPNNMAISNGLPNFNNLPCSDALSPIAFNNALPQNNLPTGNLLPSVNSRLPLSNFQITGFKIATGLEDINRFRNNPSVSNVFSNANNLQNVNFANNEVSQAVSGLQNINNFQSNNVLTNSANAFNFPTFVPQSNSQPGNINNLLNSNLPFSNGLPVTSNNFQNNNMLPTNGLPFNNHFGVPNNFLPNTGSINVNNWPINAINSNEVSIDNRIIKARGIPETFSQNGVGNGFTSNNLRFSNVEEPVKNWQYEFASANVPDCQNSLPDGEPTISNLQSDCQSTLTNNNFNLAQELVNNLQIEGLTDMPFLNGLPVAGITETVTVLNSPCS